MKPRRTRSFLGLQLTAGLIVFTTMTILVWQISEGIRGREPLTITDARLSSWLHSHHTPPITTTMSAITSLGSTAVGTAIAAAFGIYFIFRRRFYWLTAFMSSVFGGMLLNRLLKYAFHRPRPFFDDPLLAFSGYSFPSGHTMLATVLYGVVAAYFFTTTSDWWRRALIVMAAIFLIAMVGFSRIYLGAHYLSDVLGAVAEGLAWLSLCLIVVYAVWRQRISS
ncbi:MAG TPA: phosphatase PAP2 family protein [Pyrinomonadaceae bacterium]|nr:phosphatase PAP2 family protein [Pyrinomonadaceae bacterium]